MAVSGVNSSRSIYGTRNVISGLASGLDTEGLIENAVSGYKNKISALSQKRTKIEWQQEAYRSIVTKMAGFSSKYADYQSSTNLLSPSFFNQAVTVASQGANADKISASGKTGSDIQINAVKQLARAATYRIGGGAVGNNPGVTDVGGFLQATAGEAIDLTAMKDISTVAGSMTIAYGGKDARSYLDIKFGELDVFESAQDVADAINKQLEGQTVSTTNGATIKASEMLKAKVENGSVVLDGQGNDAYISSVTGDLKTMVDGKTGSDLTSFKVDGKTLSKQAPTNEYLSSATMKITLDGVTKTIKMPEKGIENEDDYIKALQKNIDDAFGTLTDGSSKLKVSNALKTDGTVYANSNELKLQFTSGQKGSTFAIGSDKASAMGFTSDGLNSYFNTNMTLGDLLGVDDDGNLKGITDGVGENGEKVYSFNLNGVEIGKFTKDTSLATIMSRINGNAEAGVNVSYSRTTNQFTFTAKDTGVAGKIDFGDGIAKELFGDTSAQGADFKAGQDSVFAVSINGGEEIEMTRASNTVDLDGLSVNLKGEFGYTTEANGTKVRDTSAEAVTFKSSTDADSIVDAIKSMVEDYNAMVTEIKNTYSTLPAQRSSGQYYEPLTDEDKEGMSESAIEAWEEKAKTGVLFGDKDLASLYQRLTKAVSMTGKNGDDLKAAGITVNYSNGLTTLSLNENQLRATLQSDPDRVMELFTKTKSSGADSDGFMQAIKEPLELYGKTTGVNVSTGTKGVLVNKAGHPLAPSTMYVNTIQQQLDKIDQEIEKWQDKMTDQVDRYTSQFSKLEQLISQMNSQSSAIAGFLGQG